MLSIAVRTELRIDEVIAASIVEYFCTHQTEDFRAKRAAVLECARADIERGPLPDSPYTELYCRVVRRYLEQKVPESSWQNVLGHLEDWPMHRRQPLNDN
ncbi:MAG: hypothetical protein V4681_00740 [Patescibacteria group bacterium]